MKGTATDSESSLRRFGLIVGLGLGTVAAVSRYRGHELVPLALASFAALLLLLALVRPRLLAGIKKAWMGLGAVLGWINTRIILTCLYVVVVSPTGLLMRIFRDPLSRHTNGKQSESSYWLPKSHGSVVREIPAAGSYPRKYERQF